MAYYRLLYFMLTILVLNFVLVVGKHHVKKAPHKDKNGDKRHFIKKHGYKLYTQRSSVRSKDKDSGDSHHDSEDGPGSLKNLDSSVILNNDDENASENGNSNPDMLLNNQENPEPTNAETSALSAGTTTTGTNQEVVDDANENHVMNQADDPVVNNNLVTSSDIVSENQAPVHGFVNGNHPGAAVVATAHNDLVTDNTQVMTQAPVHDLSPNGIQEGATVTPTNHELVADATQGGTRDINLDEGAIIGHEPITGDDSHLQAAAAANHFINNGKNVALQNNVITPAVGNVAQNGINTIFPPLGDTNHLANNVTDVDVEDDDGTNNGATAAVAVDQTQQHVLKHETKALSHDGARVDEDKVISITHPLLKPNEYNENLKEMLAKTKADLGAI